MTSFIFDIFNSSNNTNILYNIFGPIFKVIDSIFGTEFTLIVPMFLIPFILFFVLPYFIVTFISQKEFKIKNKKYIVIMDIILFILVLLCGFWELYFWSDRCIALSDRRIDYTEWLFFLRCIAFVCSFFYSLFINFKLLQKYLMVSLMRFQKIIHWTVFIIFIILFCYFIYLPIIYV